MPRSTPSRLGCLAFALLAASTAWSQQPEKFDEQALEFFEKQVRPVLAERCYECHSSKVDKPKGNLRLDSRAAALTGGDTGPAMVPGNPKESLLVDAVNYGDLYQMPPKSKLPAAEIAVLTKWVELGAPWPAEDRVTSSVPQNEFHLQERRASHWCWQPIRSPAPPRVKDAAWPRDAVDRFILARLEEKGLAPADAAERATLLRRVYFDLIGLPPTPAEVQEFLADESPQAYEKVVDRLLASPHFGERWGRHWLDLVRYAESRGHEFDYDVANVWHYRDYVIRALNADVPYDRFVVEHVAGDLLEQPRMNAAEGFNESILGTGFWFLGEWVHSPVDIRQDEADRFDNMVDVFGKTFLGLTIGCARCHDHKFDAITQADYYALAGFLQSTDYRQVRFDTLAHNTEIAKQLAALERDAAKRVAEFEGQRNLDVIARLDTYLLAAWQAMQLTDPASRERQRPEDSRQRDQQLADIAESYGIEVAALRRWIAHLRSALMDSDDPLHAWAVFSARRDDARAGERTPLEELRTRWQAQLKAIDDEQQRQDLIVDYSQCSPDDWMTDGLTFGLAPRRPGEIELGTTAEKPIPRIVREGSARRDPLWNGLKLAAGNEPEPGKLSAWNRAGRAIRTPTFEIKRKAVYYLVRGTGHAYAVVDSHRMINGPLHGSLLKDIKTGDKLVWIEHNLDRYRGHGAHLEFIAEGHEPLEVLKVVQADAPPSASLRRPNGLLMAALERGGEKREDLAHAIQQAFVKAFKPFQSGRLDKSPVAADGAALIEWMLAHPDLCVAEAASFREPAKLAAIFTDYQRQRDALVAQIRWESRTAPAMWDGSGKNERLLIRGNPRTPGEAVPRGMPEAIGGPHVNPQGTGSGRLEFAEQLVEPSNPLVARVIVNRIWHHLFGRGLSASVDNFGVLGTEPTHPELLDYLATEMIEGDWSQKRLIRRLVLSSTYRMASVTGPGDDVDPQNLLLHRQNVPRLEAEVIRDTLLAVSGRLDKRMEGKSVHVYLTPFMQGRGRPQQGPLDGDGRRSIYISIRRNFLSPMMLAFDAPQPTGTIGRRNVSNVPAQALTLMNDPLVVELARLWARRVLEPSRGVGEWGSRGVTTAEGRIALIYLTAFARAPTPQELEAALAFIESQGAEYGLSPEKADDDERVWADLCHVLINAKEFIFVN
jgi:hypothetical protein